ncbi:alginate export family protein [Poriferisphaera sp. WC338]|uniref:alginate export family protein n=1 Tax=Poriferisphaera sp. WC338 TaxID=3425129 RepID=UPI003D81B1A0
MLRSLSVLMAAGMLLVNSDVSLMAQETESEAFARPKLNPVLPQNESWYDLKGRDTQATGDLFDPIKFIPLNDDESVWLSIGGQLRTRVESWDNFGFNKNNDDTFVLSRILLHGDLHLGENVRVFVEGIGAFSNDRELPGLNRGLDVNQGSLQQAFVDVILPLENIGKLTLRTGRQHLLFGSQRLVSPLPWANTQRKWDGFSANLKTDSADLTAFYTHFVPVKKYQFDQEESIKFWGLFAKGAIENTGAKWNAYYFGYDRPSATFNGTTGAEERHTLGARLFGNLGDSGIDYDFEGAYQFGRVGAGDVRAYMLAAEVGYKFDVKTYTPRVAMGLDIASGDDSAGGDVQTFNQLFPLGHKYLGFIDIIGRQNIIDFHQSIGVPITKKLKVSAAHHYFWRADENDGLYNAGGGLVRAGGAGTSKKVGSEIDLTVKYAIDRHATIQAGYSHFFAGQFIEDTGTSDDIDFAYLQFVYNF